MNPNPWKRSTSCSGGNCVEVQYTRSTHCADNACVEVAFQSATGCASGSCVEVGRTAGGVLIRDSKNPGQAPLRFTTEEWAAFLEGVRAGEFGG